MPLDLARISVMKRSAFCLIAIISIAGVVLFCVWQHEPRCRPSTFDGVHEGLRCLACSPDGHTFITGGTHGDLQLWDVSKNSVFRRIVTGHDGVTAVAYSADGSIVASGGEEGTVKIWDTTNWRERAALAKSSTVLSLLFTNEANVLAIGEVTGEIRIYDPKAGVQMGSLKGHTEQVFSMSFCPQTNMLASASGDGSVRLWSVKDRVETGVLRGQNGRIKSVLLLPDGKSILFGDEIGSVELWNISGRQLLRA